MKVITSRWRNHAAPIIARVLKKYPEEGPEQRKALRDAYPFGERKYHPYKIWISEVAKQKGGRKVVFVDPGRPLVFGSKNNPYGKNQT